MYRKLINDSKLIIRGIKIHEDGHPETYLITLPDGVILDPHPVKPADIADKDENGEKGDPIYQGVVFGTTEMPLKMKNVLKLRRSLKRQRYLRHGQSEQQLLPQKRQSRSRENHPHRSHTGGMKVIVKLFERLCRI